VLRHHGFCALFCNGFLKKVLMFNKAMKPRTPIPPPEAVGRVVAAKGKQQFSHPMLDQARQLVAQGRPGEAARTLEELARQVLPFEAGQLFSLASSFARPVDGKRALALAEEATRCQPEMAQAWLALTQARDQLRDRKGSIEAAMTVLKLKASPTQWVEAGLHLSRLGQDGSALEAVRKGYQASGEAVALASPTLRVALQSADWALADRITPRLRALHAQGKTTEAAETPRTHLLWCDDEATNIQVVTQFAKKVFASMPAMQVKPRPEAGKTKKLRVGYLSFDFRDHATALLVMGLMRHHDRNRFELYAYCASWDDGTALRRDIISRFDVARSISQVSDHKAAVQIAKDQIDVLIDLNGTTEGTRMGVLAWRPAPVQISYLGFPGTAGGRFVDYVIADDYTVPLGVEALYPEKLIRTPPVYQINDYAARWLPPPPDPASIGLPPGALVIGMFNNVNKVGSLVWATWMEILKAVPEAVLWQLEPGPVAKAHLLAAAALAGVTESRLIFVPKARQEAHVARLQLCHLVLDPWPYGGHTTTGDALFAGVAVVALEGRNFASRVSGSLLCAAGLEQLVRPDCASYVETAVRLLQQPKELLRLRQHLLGRRQQLPVFDACTRTRQLEAAYLAAHARAVQGLPTDHLRAALRSPPTQSATPTPENYAIRLAA
jgi:predicted O-linked N-acetylglucosamine transferase (SPINDLY family)